jgi:AcrR family transcriptional regulator
MSRFMERSVSEDPVREKILKAALELMQTYGVKKFTQPQVARAAGIRQSHLTYYFPRKIDLIMGLLQGHGRPAESTATDAAGPGHAAAIRKGLDVLTSDPGRMRFFLSLILEAQLEPGLRSLVDDHMTRFDARVANYYGRKAGDPDVLMFLSALRGLGMRRLVGDGDDGIDIAAMEARFQLTPAGGTGDA